MNYTVTEYAKDFYLLSEERVRQFLFVGKDEAVLIDTGFGDSHVIDEVRKITDKPVKVLMTHGDGDHTGGLDDFGECYIHEKDANMVKPGIKVNFINEGDIFTVGDYKLEAVHIPGHTYGSVAFLDREKKYLFPGDSVAKEGPIFMFGETRDLDCYLNSMKKLLAIDDIETVFPCHGEGPVGREYIGYCLEDAEAYKNGELTGEPHEFMPCKVYTGKHVKFLF